MGGGDKRRRVCVYICMESHILQTMRILSYIDYTLHAYVPIPRGQRHPSADSLCLDRLPTTRHHLRVH